MKAKIVAVIGPTAAGKTDLGVFLGQRFGGEIVSADAKQVYIGMDIGTAKEKNLPVPQYLIDIKEPGARITAAEYQRLAYQVIDDILARGLLPIIVGGSGLYAEAVLEGYRFEEGKKSGQKAPKYEVLKIGVGVDRAAVRKRAAARIKKWARGELFEEIRHLLAKGVSPEWLNKCGLEYRYFTSHLLGEISLEAAIKKSTSATNDFIKRQYTWWRRHPNLRWVKNEKEAARLVDDFLKEKTVS